MKLSRSIADEVEHQPRRLAVDCASSTNALSIRTGLLDVEHDARAALHHEAEAERLDQPAAALAGLRRQLEGHLRQVDDHAIGVGEREGAQVDLAREVHDEAGAGVVAAEPGVGRDRKRRPRPAARAAFCAADRSQFRPSHQQPPEHRDTTRSVCPNMPPNPEPPSSLLTPIRRSVVNPELNGQPDNPTACCDFSSVLACHPPELPAVSKGCLRFEYRVCRVRASGTFAKESLPIGEAYGGHLAGGMRPAFSLRAKGTARPGVCGDGRVEAETLVRTPERRGSAKAHFRRASREREDRWRGALPPSTGRGHARSVFPGPVCNVARFACARVACGPAPRLGVARDPPFHDRSGPSLLAPPAVARPLRADAP